MKAKNAAGYSEAVSANFTKIAAVVPAPPTVTPPNGGSEFVVNPKIPMLVLGLSASTVSTKGGQVLVLNTKNMDKLTEVLIGDIKVKIDITANAFSDSAKEKIAAAGGKTTEV